MPLKRKHYLTHRIRQLVERECKDVPDTMFWHILQLIEQHEREEVETEKQKQDDEQRRNRIRQ